MVEAQDANGLFQVRDRDGAMTEMGAHQTSRRGLPHDRCLPCPDRRNLSPELANGEFGAAVCARAGGHSSHPGGRGPGEPPRPPRRVSRSSHGPSPRWSLTRRSPRGPRSVRTLFQAVPRTSLWQVSVASSVERLGWRPNNRAISGPWVGAPNGNRTRVFAVKGRRPGPLDDGRGLVENPVLPDRRDAIRSAVRAGKPAPAHRTIAAT